MIKKGLSLFFLFLIIFPGCISKKYEIEQHIREKEAIVYVNKSIDYADYENKVRKMEDFASPERQLELWLLREGIFLAECKYLKENGINCSQGSSNIFYSFVTREGFTFNKSTDWLLGNETAIIIVNKLKQPIERNDTAYIESIKEVIKNYYKGFLPSDVDKFLKDRIGKANKSYLLPSTTLINFEKNVILATYANQINESEINIDIRYRIYVDGYKIINASAGKKQLKITNNSIILSYNEIKNIKEPIVIKAEKTIYWPYTPLLIAAFILLIAFYLMISYKRRKKKKIRIEDLIE